MTFEGHFSTAVTLCAQLTRDLLAIAKFLVFTAGHSANKRNSLRAIYRGIVCPFVCPSVCLSVTLVIQRPSHVASEDYSVAGLSIVNSRRCKSYHQRRFSWYRACPGGAVA